MESSGRLGFSNVTGAAKKKRSITARRPRNDSQSLADFGEVSPSSFIPPLHNNMFEIDEGRSDGSDEAANNTSSRSSSDRRRSGDDSKRPSEGILSPTNWRHTSNPVHFGVVSNASENKVKKVKLKVGGVTRTINAMSVHDANPYGHADTHQLHQKMDFEENSDGNHSLGAENRDSKRAMKEYTKSGSRVDGSRSRMPYEGKSAIQEEKHGPIRKSKRVIRKRSLDGNSDEDDDDEEMRYIDKVKKSKGRSDYGAVDDEEGGCRKQRKISMVLKRKVDVLYDVNTGDYSSSKSGKKLRSERESEDTDYVEEEEPYSDGEPEIKRKSSRKEFVDFVEDSKEEMTVTTRRRARQAGKGFSSNSISSLIEFPDGLPPAPPKKQKEKLTEVEQQLKRAEALQRRRMQVEKAARESEAEAIRKILGQDSSRKKRENKIKKRQEELAQEKAANAMVLASDIVRWNMGPSGTTITFPNEMGLPSIFDSKPCSYPPPREKCAGPSCTNPYKYRDSKSKLPLCSLQCYKAIHEKASPLSAC